MFKVVLPTRVVTAEKEKCGKFWPLGFVSAHLSGTGDWKSCSEIWRSPVLEILQYLEEPGLGNLTMFGLVLEILQHLEGSNILLAALRAGFGPFGHDGLRPQAM